MRNAIADLWSNIMATALTLKEALKANRLDDFIAQAEADGVTSATEALFDGA